MDGWRMRLRQLDAALDDAHLDLDTITLRAGRLTVQGWRFGYANRHRARFPIILTFERVARWLADDPHDLSELIIDAVDYDEAIGAFVLTGPVPGRLVVFTGDRTFVAESGTVPVAVRRWGRWTKAERGE